MSRAPSRDSLDGKDEGGEVGINNDGMKRPCCMRVCFADGCTAADRKCRIVVDAHVSRRLRRGMQHTGGIFTFQALPVDTAKVLRR